MNTSSLKSYAPEARKAFVAAITRRAVYYGLRGTDEIESCEVQGDVAMIGGQAFPARVAKQREKLIGRIQAQGYDAFIDSVAYTWFNRFVALRFMEVNGYLEHGYRVLSCREGSHLPEIVEQAEHLDLEGLDRNQVVELKLDGSKDEQLYQLLIKAQCNALHQSLPFLFEKVDGELELLLPDNLLHSDSLVRTLVDSIEEEQWHEVEILGWLYQFFISERKDEVIGKVVKSEDIPAATQLFTPNWIVKYMVQNSLGAQWLATYPESVFKEKLEYYIEPAEQTAEVQQQLAAITPDSLNPEEITLVDPAVGSGHILVEAYDLFKEIYLSRGYLPRDIASHILTKNLYGIEIDDRAAQLASLALMFKARGDDRQIFERDVRPMIVSLQESGDLESEIVTDSLNAPLASDGSRANISQAVVGRVLALNVDAKTFGSLIQVPEDLASELESLKARVDSVSVSGGLLEKPVAVKFKQLVDQSVLLAKRYDNVVANPPYMGSKYLTPQLKKHLKDNFKGYEKDLFSAFIDRNLSLVLPNGRLGFMSPFVWMFI